MFGFGKVSCVVCQNQVARKDGLRLRDHKDTVICRACYKAWEQSGRKCGQCETPVRGTQSVGVFPTRQAVGHADCGGEILAISF